MQVNGACCNRCSKILLSKRVLDIGCGYGWHCKYAVEQGAAQVLGIDISHKMLDEAQKRNADPKIEYRLCGIEDYDYPAAAWDCVVSNLALHYIADLDRVFANVHRTLKLGGMFLFNIEHSSFTASVHQEWVYGVDGQRCTGLSTIIFCPVSASPTF